MRPEQRALIVQRRRIRTLVRSRLANWSDYGVTALEEFFSKPEALTAVEAFLLLLPIPSGGVAHLAADYWVAVNRNRKALKQFLEGIAGQEMNK